MINTTAKQSKRRQEDIIFTNFDRVNEEFLFQHVLDVLSNTSGVVIGKKTIGPSEDFYDCSFDGEPFTLFYDGDYGVSIHCKSKSTRLLIIGLFSK